MSNNARDINVVTGNINVKTPIHVSADNVGITGSIRLGQDSGLSKDIVRPIRVNNSIMMEKGSKIRYTGASNLERWIVHTDSDRNLSYNYHNGETNNASMSSTTNIESKIIFDGDDDNEVENITDFTGAIVDDGTPAQGASIELCDNTGTGRFKLWVFSDDDGHTLQLSGRNASGNYEGLSVIGSISKT